MYILEIERLIRKALLCLTQVTYCLGNVKVLTPHAVLVVPRHLQKGAIVAINSISGTSRISSLADLWAEKIQANKEAKGGSRQDAVSVSEEGKIRVNNPAAAKVANAQAAEETDNEDEFTRQIKQLQKQLKLIMDQIAKIKASGMSDEMKAQQMMALNAQAVQIQGQITKVLAQQASAAKKNGGVSATA